MNNLIRIIIAILISLTFSVGAFASDVVRDIGSDSTQSDSLNLRDINTETIEKVDILESDNKVLKKKEEIRKSIIAFALEIFRARDTKTLQTIDQTFKKRFPDEDDRIIAYEQVKNMFLRYKKSNSIT